MGGFHLVGNTASGIDITRFSRHRTVIVRIAGKDVALAVDKKLREATLTRLHGWQFAHHDALFVRPPLALEFLSTTDGNKFPRIGRINDGCRVALPESSGPNTRGSSR